jgi:hypothetical protein
VKPRLLPEPLTDEDRAAWFDWQVNRSRDLRLWGALERSFESDRRDADLMFACQETWRAGRRQSRAWMPYKGPLAISWCGYLVDCGGGIA